MTNLELAICEAENSGEIDLDTRDTMLGILNEKTLLNDDISKMESDIKKLDSKVASIYDEISGLDDKIEKAKKDNDVKKIQKYKTRKSQLESNQDELISKMRQIRDQINTSKNKTYHELGQSGRLDPKDQRKYNSNRTKEERDKHNKYLGVATSMIRSGFDTDYLGPGDEYEKIKQKINERKERDENAKKSESQYNSIHKERVDNMRKLMSAKRKVSQAQELENKINNTKLMLPGKRKSLNERISNIYHDYDTVKSEHDAIYNKYKKESVREEIYEAELNGKITDEERRLLIDYMDM